MSAATGGDLRGAVVVVTGATGAAGPAVVSSLALAGASVIAAGRDQGRLDAVLATVSESEPRLRSLVHTSVIDLNDEQATRDWGRALIAEHGRVDGLIQLVGGWRGGAPIEQVDLADYEILHNDLVRTLQHATRALLQPISASPVGRLVIVSTTGLAAPTANNAIYLTAKAAAETWVRAVAHGWRDTPDAAVVVRVKALLTEAMVEQKPQAAFRGYVPVAELAQRITELFAESADRINGEVVTLDGRSPA